MKRLRSRNKLLNVELRILTVIDVINTNKAGLLMAAQKCSRKCASSWGTYRTIMVGAKAVTGNVMMATRRNGLTG